MKLIWRVFFISVGTVTCATFIFFMVVDSVAKRANVTTDSFARNIEDPTWIVASNNSYYREIVIQELIKKYRLDFKYPLKESPWSIAAKWVKPREIHPENSSELGSILKALTSSRIIVADVGYGGTQPKVLLTLDGGQKAVFKPKWYERDYIEESPDPYGGVDRHNGEIVAFHLGRILEFRRTPLAVGRTIDLNKEILPVATAKLKDTFIKKDNNTCFYGVCHYCKTPVCANGTNLEGSLILWLPDVLKLKMHLHPWRRTYKRNKPAKWEESETYCNKVKAVYLQNLGSEDRLLDIIDTAILDFLIGNADRHNYEVFANFSISALLILDNAKSVGNPYKDERTILAPLYQCCRLRYNTWQRLLVLQEGILSRVLDSILSLDPIAPVITDKHLTAIDRRLQMVLKEIESCIKKHSPENVLTVGNFDRYQL